MKEPDGSGKIIERLATALGRALTSMTGGDFHVAAASETDAAELVDPLTWEQTLSCASQPCLWMVAGRDLWTAAGQMTLAAVGIDEVTDEDCRSTWQEIIAQAVGGLCGFLSADLKHEITAGKGEETDRQPSDGNWVFLTATSGKNKAWHIKIGCSQALLNLYDKSMLPENHPPAQEAAYSKTFDLLLDVALPVSVSFGRTSLEIREVLKLSTGSIVELNRFMAEPVDVIVNDCVIARGEVVVVDGNYGVRITQLSSREDRMKFGMAQTPPGLGAAALR